MDAVPHRSPDFVALLAQLFPPEAFAGLTYRTLNPPNSPLVTVAYLYDAVNAGDLERVILPPLAAGDLCGGPEELAQSGRFAASQLKATTDSAVLQIELMTGLTAVHVDGHAGVLLVGGASLKRQPATFNSYLSNNLGILIRTLASPDLRVEALRDPVGSRVVLVYLTSVASAETVAAVKRWSLCQKPVARRDWKWQDLLRLIRLPPTLSHTTPLMAADALRRGYVAILSSSEPAPMLAPTTLHLGLSGPRDAGQSRTMRDLLFWFRFGLAAVGKLAAAWLIAVSGYHHSLIPGPFLVALAASRQNAPFPITLEMFVIAVMDDLAMTLGEQLRGEQGMLLALLAVILSIMVGVEVGVVSAVSGVFSIVAVVARLAVPGTDARRMLRAWRYLFMVAAAALGVYGLTLCYFVLLVYLAAENFFGHAVCEPLGGERQ
ncbi:MAG: spore germination protein [Mycobacterium leprae]